MESQEDMANVQQMKVIVPEFKSNNSIYEKCDQRSTKILSLSKGV